MIVGACIGLLGYQWVLFSRRLPRREVLKRTGARAAFLVALVIVALPAGWLEGWLAFLVLVGGMWLFEVLLFIVHLAGSRRCLRRGLVSGPQPGEPLEGEVPTVLVESVDRLIAAGFGSLGASRCPNDAIEIVLLRVRDGVVAQVMTSQRERKEGSPDVELTSVVADRHGMVCTATSSRGPRLWEGELLQVFPGAPIGDLVGHHVDSLAFLTSRGVHFGVVTRDEVDALMLWAFQMGTGAAVRAPRAEFWKEVFRVIRGSEAHLGRLADDPAIDARLSAFWETESAPPVPGT